MRDSFGLSRNEKLMQVDSNREKLYLLCKDRPMSLSELQHITQFSMHKVKAYVPQLVKEKHLERLSIRDPETKNISIKFKATENAYKPRTAEEIDECIKKQKEAVKQPKKYPYDDLIANNPNLRKVCLFDTKPTKDFLSAQKFKIDRSPSSCWSMFESF